MSMRLSVAIVYGEGAREDVARFARGEDAASFAMELRDRLIGHVTEPEYVEIAQEGAMVRYYCSPRCPGDLTTPR